MNEGIYDASPFRDGMGEQPCVGTLYHTVAASAPRFAPHCACTPLSQRFIAILIAQSVIVVPFRIGFDWMPQGNWLVADVVTDVAFGIDIMLSFRTAYEAGQVLVTVPNLMSLHYLRGWFVIDFLSTIPFDR